MPPDDKNPDQPEFTFRQRLTDDERRELDDYMKQRLRGTGKELATARSELETLRRMASDASGAATSVLELEELRLAVKGYADAFVAGLPEAARSLVPRSLPANELLQWIASNHRALAGGETRAIAVHTGVARPAPLLSPEELDRRRAESIERKGHAFVFGGSRGRR